MFARYKNRRRMLASNDSINPEPVETEASSTAVDSTDPETTPTYALAQKEWKVNTPAVVKPAAVSEKKTISAHSHPGKKAMFSVIRHFLAVLILCGIGYAYQKQQMTSIGSNSQTSEPFDPFSEWNTFEEAPGYNASNSEAPGFTESPLPDPIPVPSDFKKQLPTDLVSLGESMKETPKTTPADNKSTPATQSNSRSRRANSSLWDEPTVNVTEKAETSAKPEKSGNFNNSFNTNNAGNTNKQKGSPFGVPLPSDLEDLVDSTKSKFQEVQKKVETLSQPVQEAPKTVASNESWRQFTIGNGNQRTVCVMDDSISNDPAVLSALFSSLRSEWLDGAHSHQKLEVLIANPNASLSEAELSRRLAELSPSRLVRVSRGMLDRGKLIFSSDQESIDALMSVPGSYRVTSELEINGVEPASKYSTVNIQLPNSLKDQEAATARLIYIALLEGWNTETYSPSLSSLNQPEDKLFNPFSVVKQEKIIPPSIVESLPGPSSATEVKNPFDREIKIPDYKTTDELIAGLFSTTSNELAKPADVADVLEERITESADQFRQRITPSPVEILPSPPIYQTKVDERVNSALNSFYRLPPPPQ